MGIRSVVSLATITDRTQQQEYPLPCYQYSMPVLPFKEFHMLNAEEIAAMDIEEIKANFFDLMDTVVTTYGDNQEKTTEQQESEGNAKK